MVIEAFKGDVVAKVSIKDVAREAGVSLGTVSNALNHPEKVKPETLELVNQAIDELGFLPNQSARRLAGGTSKTFGLVLPSLAHGFSLQIANGAQTEAHAHGYDLLIANAANDDILQASYLRYFLGSQMAGVLVQPMAGGTWKAPVLPEELPTVFLNVHAEGSGTFVVADNEGEGRLIAQHALECGATRVCVVGKAEFSQMELRVKAIAEELESSKVELEVINEGDWNTAEDGVRIGRELAEREVSERPDFVIGLTDVLAAGTIAGLVEAGLSVPADIRVAGCDGNPLAWGGMVPFTTCESAGYEMGRRGVLALLDLIEGKIASGETTTRTIGTSLIKRESTSSKKKSAVSAATELGLNLGSYLA